MAIILGALVFIIFLFFVSKSNNALEKCIQEIPAEVVDHKQDVFSDSSDFNPVVTYRFEGKDYRCNLNRSLGTKEIEAQYPIGKSIVVYIDPEKPAVCSENPAQDRNDNSFILILILIAVLLALCFR